MKLLDLNSNQIPAGPSPARRVAYYLGHALIYLGLLLLLLVMGWLVIQIGRISTSYRAINQQIDRLETGLSASPTGAPKTNLAQLQTDLQTLSREIETLSTAASPFTPLAPYLGWLPGYGGDLQALPTLLAVSHDMSQLGTAFSQALAQSLKTTQTGRPPLLPYRVAQTVTRNVDLAQVTERLQTHQITLAQLDTGQLSPRTARRVEQLNRRLPQLVAGLQLLPEIPRLMGSESPQTYLILTQNADELRPAGGYINAAGHLVLSQGRIVDFVMQDSYAVDRLSEDYPYPPQPLYDYMAAEYWVLRDASWSPDFPTAARTALELYQLGQGVSAEGVVAMDQHAIAYLLRAFGPVTVEDEQVRPDNVIELMREQWAPEPGQDFDGAWWSQRKSFMLTLAETLKIQLEQSPESIDLMTLAGALQQAAAEKHLLIYLTPPEQTFTLPPAWSGQLRPAVGDYLMVVDANVGFNKASAAVERHLDYRLALAPDGSGQAAVRLTYRHQAQKQVDRCSIEIRYDPLYEQNMARCYWNYHSLIVPASAQLLRGPGVAVPGTYLLRGRPTTGEIDTNRLSAEKISWSQLFLLPPEESITLDYAYSLPPGTARVTQNQGDYRLLLQKQPGTLAPTAQLSISLPDGAQLLHSRPKPDARQGTELTYRLTLKTDQEIKLSYHLP